LTITVGERDGVAVLELIDLNTGLVVIDREECFKLLASEEVGRLAVIAGGRPEIFPVNYAVHDEGVVFRTDPGTKLAAAIRGPVSFEVDHLDRETRTAWSVIVHGSAHHITPFDSSKMRSRIAHLALYPWTETPKTHLIRIVPTAVSGRWIKGPTRQTNVPDHCLR
jgi:nitroimidazol reductase NimA-like FMN-containing flavoprotein (pyridoxamine 5'-phosphate oxidase superfamily)